MTSEWEFQVALMKCGYVVCSESGDRDIGKNSYYFKTKLGVQLFIEIMKTMNVPFSLSTNGAKLKPCQTLLDVLS